MKFLFISLLLSCISIMLLFSENSEITDDLEIINFERSAIDSLTVLPDSAYSPPLLVPPVRDTLQFNLKEVQLEVDSLIQAEQYKRDHRIILPYYFYNENFHVKTYPEPDLYITKNGFSLVPYISKPSHLYQNIGPLYQRDFRKNYLKFFRDDYSLPVFMTRSYLALGDENMNHVGVIFRKGYLIGIKDLNFTVAYLGQEGNWIGINEQSKHLDLGIDYTFDLGKFYLNYSTLDQKTTPEKLLGGFIDKEKVTEKASDLSFYYQNPYINIGMRYETQEVDTLTRKCYDLKVDKRIRSDNHDILGRIEYLRIDDPEDDYFLFSLDHKSKFDPMTIDNYGFFRDEENYSLNNRLKLRLYKGLALISDNHFSSSFTDEISVTSAGFGYGRDFLNLELLYSHKNEFSDHDALELKTGLNFTLGKVEFIIDNRTTYLLDFNFNDLSSQEVSLLPEIRLKSGIVMIYHLHHDNALKIGLNQLFFTDYFYQQSPEINPVYIEEVLNLDGFLAVQISNLFEIRLDLINITNETHIFGFDRLDPIPGMHYNLNIFWLFIN